MKKSSGYQYTYSPQTPKTGKKWDVSFLFYFVAVVIVVLATIGYVVLQTKITRTSFAIEHIHKTIDRLEKDNNKYKLVIAEKTNLRYVEERAKKEIGMRKPKDSQYVFIGKDTLLDANTLASTAMPKSSMAYFMQNVKEWFKEKTVVAAGALGD